ncbi:hypothetical protein SLS55_007189 [Diplodia seriata]|uniref:Sterigmatocystin biosynthesis monooxygenase stcW n=1 Tax=Diplodia seriata TaxID=420778 RepID=A0ABR3CBJ7_9PEZI
MRIICTGAGASGLLLAYKIQRSFRNYTLTIYDKNSDVAGTWVENRYPGCACDVPSHSYTYSFWPHRYDDATGSGPSRVYAGSDEIKGYFKGFAEAWGLGKSSAIQVLPAIQPHVKSLTTFIRSPTWIAPPIGSSGQREYTEEEKHVFKTQPGALLRHRKEIEDGMNKYFAVFQKNSAEQTASRAALTTSMRTALSTRPDLAVALIPDWSVGCRRFTPGPGYLESLCAPNVTAVLPSPPPNTGDVTAITPSGTGVITAAGTTHPGPFDALICATGFNTSFRPRFPLVNGATGRDLRSEWAPPNDARGYLATAAAGFPNYVTIFGPASPTGNGPVLGALEAQADYVCALLDRFQTEPVASFAPKAAAVDEFNDWLDAFMGRMVWSDDCRSWYKKHSASGRVTGLWPGSMLHFVEALREVRWDDWEVEYRGNRFAWLGNGFSRTEVDHEADLSYYVREVDEGGWASREMRRKALTRRKRGVEETKAKL